MDKLSYALGLGIGQQLRQMGLKDVLVIEDFAQSITDMLQGNELKVKSHEAQGIVNAFFQEQEKKMSAEKAEAGKKAKEEGAVFLQNNKTRPGVITTASGLQYEVLKEGNGKKPKATDKVRCHYEVIVDEVQKMANSSGVLRILDIGTGSGCIALALKHLLGERAKVEAWDLSEEALLIAQKNAESLGLDVHFEQHDILAPETYAIGVIY